MELLLPLLAVAVLYSFVSLRVIRQYERGVAFFLGRFWGTKGPGLIFLPAGFAAQKRVSLRIVALDIPPQDVITRDNVSVKVNAVLYMRVTDPAKAIIEIEDYLYATSQLAQTTLRSVLGEVELDELLSDREKINAILKNIIDERTDAVGHRGLRGRGEGRGPARADEARHGPPGRGRAGAARQGDRRAGRAPGVARRWPRPPAPSRPSRRAPASLSADGHRDRRGEQLHHDLSRSRSSCSGPFCSAQATPPARLAPAGGRRRAAGRPAPRRRSLQPDVQLRLGAARTPRRNSMAERRRRASIARRSSGSSSARPSCRPPTATSARS